MGAESTLCFHSLIPILPRIVLRVVVVTVTGGPLGRIGGLKRCMKPYVHDESVQEGMNSVAEQWE